MLKHSKGSCQSPSRFEQHVWILLLTLVTLVLLCGCSTNGVTASATPDGGGRGGRKGMGAGDVPVTTAFAKAKDVPVEVQVIGNVEAYSTISVKAQVGGELTRVYFHEGDYVHKGDQLFTVDPRSFEAALNLAIANNLRDQATLAQTQANVQRDEAQARYASSQASRYADLFQQKIISRDQNDQLHANAEATAQAVAADKAAIESARAAIEASKASVDSARVQLGYSSIRSPIDGRTGNLAVKQGNVVTANNMELVTINQIEPIYVTFAVPEAQLPAVKRYMAEHPLRVTARAQDDPTSPEDTGTLTFVDNSVDTTTGTIKLKGTFPNAGHRLWPGQFVRVTLLLTTRPNAIVIPNEAVQTGQNGSFVYIVKPDRTVEVQPVTTGARVDEDMVIESGLAVGDKVVTQGQLRLAPGSRVVERGGTPSAPGRGRGQSKS